MTAAAVANGFTVATPLSLIQCTPYQISWQGGKAPYYLVVTKGGDVNSILEDLGPQQGTTHTWTVDQPTGSSVTFYVTDATGQSTASAPSNAITGGKGSCSVKGDGGSSPSAGQGSGSSSAAPKGGSAPSPAPSSGSGNSGDKDDDDDDDSSSSSSPKPSAAGAAGAGNSTSSSTSPSGSTASSGAPPNFVTPPPSGGVNAGSTSSSSTPPAKSGSAAGPRAKAAVLLGAVGLLAFIASY